ncbi:putative bifunctional purine Ade1 [Xylaria intraflava]|nr:putative bifunctional purine Ade1 [Xylaria intraflava]
MPLLTRAWTEAAEPGSEPPFRIHKPERTTQSIHGGPEHALAWKLSQSPLRIGESVSNIKDVAANNYPGLVQLARQLDIGLVIAGPDLAVIDGIEGYFRDSGIPCLEPSKQAAEVEGLKAFAKEFKWRQGIPTAEYEAFDNYSDVKRKGRVFLVDQNEAQQALGDIMVNLKFGSAGNSVVIEEYLAGNEISVGPNTGGMGVYAPVPFVSPVDMEEIERAVLQPTFQGLGVEGRPFVRMLFTKVMLTSSGSKVLEYNARFGDPETQSLMLLLSNTDLAEVLLACTKGELVDIDINVSPRFAYSVTVTAGGYPEKYLTGVHIFHAGTKYVDGQLVITGGRVFSVTTTGSTLEDAVSVAYSGIKAINFENMFYRKDIAAV